MTELTDACRVQCCTTEGNMATCSARFVPVDAFFEGYQNWESLGAVISAGYDLSTLTLSVTLLRTDGVPCVLQVSTLLQYIVRTRFDPNNSRASDYPHANVRTILQNTQAELNVADAREYQVY